MSNSNGSDDNYTMDRTADIVAAYVSKNPISPEMVAELIKNVARALDMSAVYNEPEPEPLVPAVPIKKSITPDYIVCLDDGKKCVTLKKHLLKLGLTPDEYRKKWGLPHDYPMSAPNYTIRRSVIAKQTGLGQKRES
jgi:predicted transcriptional regulator